MHGKYRIIIHKLHIHCISNDGRGVEGDHVAQEAEEMDEHVAADQIHDAVGRMGLGGGEGLDRVGLGGGEGLDLVGQGGGEGLGLLAGEDCA
ncbi:hypothetical protein CR513_26216, partial [Mucuna pruriens]